MISLSAKVRFFLYGYPTDMRKSFEGLGGLVRCHLQEDVQSGDVYLFINRRGDRTKLLVWDRDGFWIHYKRLEKGRFCLSSDSHAGPEISYSDLVMLLEGIDLKKGKKSIRYGR